MRTRERVREAMLRQMQETEATELAALLWQEAHQPLPARSHKAWALRSWIIGLTGRTAERRRILADLEAARLAQDGAPEAIATALLVLTPWIGTASDLLWRVRPGAAPTPAHLSLRLRRSGAAMMAVGVRVQFRREGGTGRRLIVAQAAERSEASTEVAMRSLRTTKNNEAGTSSVRGTRARGAVESGVIEVRT